jgi:hypothetical protein
MVLGAKRGADRVIADRVIIGACVAADARLPVKLSAAVTIKRTYVLFS